MHDAAKAARTATSIAPLYRTDRFYHEYGTTKIGTEAAQSGVDIHVVKSDGQEAGR
ncbi:hypothetical protein [Lichenifustis flavocetrariae]|uniref:Uncharacterized protein n=1 Tax=Lichenifustis flavocetrariae TaxID=2949735 RepID=A0AA41Z1W3_9HYPH|nr:hypothetical protein [Lichenifustis flavocetrariae]MCW6507752.1 hypothetical protein [Lichenifustis flavocetrariae]